MRPSRLLLIGLVLAGALWLALRPADVGGEYLGEPPPAEPEGPEPWRRLRSGTLLLRVRAPDGSVPAEAEAGYKTDKGERLRHVHAPEGEAEFTDAPLGELIVLARAPGFRPLSRPTRVEAGSREELVLVLEPERPPPR